MNRELIFLIGYMGAGKTTAGRMLAKALGKEFIDLDDLVEIINNRTLQDIFEKEGEESFRKLEQSALHTLQGKKNLVIACGGGCAAYSSNMKWMNEHGITVYMRCRPGTLFHRIAPEKRKRPLLAKMDDVDIMEYILESLKKRLPYYVQAQFTVNAGSDPESVTTEISEKLRPFLIAEKAKITSSSPD